MAGVTSTEVSLAQDVTALMSDDLATRQARARLILRKLGRAYPDAKCGLDFQSPLHLLVATILSAQCTDERINQVTPALFARYQTAEAFANADLDELKDYLRSVNYYQTKAKKIIQCCKQLVERHHGQVPRTMEELVALAGVGRKTANVVLSEAYGVPGITVDTHMGRLARRMGLTVEQQPEKVEADLMQVFSRRMWNRANHLIITHGRRVCTARNPQCANCVLARVCPKVGVGSSRTAAATTDDDSASPEPDPAN
jgi:endonuclease-3